MGMMITELTREEVLADISEWTVWPVPPLHFHQLGGTDWSMAEVDGMVVLTHSIHDPITRADWERARSPANPTPTAEPAPNKYQRIVPSTTIDVYDVLHAYSVTNPATQHAVKKLLQPGNRGHKDTLTDLREALASIQRAIQIEEQSCQQ